MLEMEQFTRPLVTSDEVSKSYMFDRNPVLFGYILCAHHTGVVHLPHDICYELMQDELDFWRIPTSRLAPCCWWHYRQSKEEYELLEKIGQKIKREEERRAEVEELSKKSRMMTSIYNFLEHPTSSTPALIWSWIYMLLLAVSMTLLCLATVGAYRIPISNDDAAPGHLNTTSNETINRSWSDGKPKSRKLIGFISTREHPDLFWANVLLLLFFLVEIVLRLVSCPSKRLFLRSYNNLNDLMTIPSLLIIYLISFVNPTIYMLNWVLHVYFLILICYLTRPLRMLDLLYHKPSVYVMMQALKTSLIEIMPLYLIMAIGILTFAACMFYTEINEDGIFYSVPGSFWWTVVTMTTVGYGDVIPVTIFGQVTAAMWAIIGVLFIGVPIPVFIRNFDRHFRIAKMKRSLMSRADAHDCNDLKERNNLTANFEISGKI